MPGINPYLARSGDLPVGSPWASEENYAFPPDILILWNHRTSSAYTPRRERARLCEKGPQNVFFEVGLELFGLAFVLCTLSLKDRYRRTGRSR